MRKLTPWLIVMAVIWMTWRHFAPISRAPGVLAGDEPEQVLFSTPQPVLERKSFTLKPLALYTIKARILGMKHYWGEEPDKLSPYDAAVGWGRMSDTAVLEKLDISQSLRFFHWRYWGDHPPIPVDEIISHAANMHLIPDDDRVLSQIAGLKKGMLVRMSGYLVEATHPRAVTPWRSSLTRDDDGAGACELMLVKVVQVLGD